MALLPQPQHSTVIKIYDHYEKRNKEQKPRPHLGASLIGHDCERHLWYSFRWSVKVPFIGRMLRLFDTGNREEFRLVIDLRNAGVTVYDKDPASGKQFQFHDHGGHFSGSMDAAMKDLVEAPKTWHVGEFKTHNAKSFAKLVKVGVKKAKPQHWRQMNTYMGWSIMESGPNGMRRAAYFAVNKDTDDIYMERVEFDQATFDLDREKAKRVIEAVRPPQRINSDPSWFECKFCDHHAVCHVGNVPVTSCRSCVHATPHINGEGGQWSCDLHGKSLTFEEQIAACDAHLYIPDLVGFAEPVESGDDWVLYKHRQTGKVFFNAAAGAVPQMQSQEKAEHLYTSKELHVADPLILGDGFVNDLKETFDAKVVG